MLIAYITDVQHPGSRRGHVAPPSHSLNIVTWAYATAMAALWIAIQFLVDRAWPATLIGFGPRWFAALPLVVLAPWTVLAAARHRVRMNAVLLAVASGVLLFPVMGLRVGMGRAPAASQLRVMTHNLGESHVTAEALDGLMRAERIDVAALQECPFNDLAPKQFGWEFFYGGDICLVSRFPFTVLDVPDPDSAWVNAGFGPFRFDIQTPAGTVQLLNVHLETIRGALEGPVEGSWRARFTANRQEARRQSVLARARLDGSSRHLIVIGDFNMPVESAIYRDVWGDLLNAFTACGRGFGFTKFTPVFAVRIDHVLTSRDWRCTDAYVRSSPYGGDHAPVIVSLTRQ